MAPVVWQNEPGLQECWEWVLYYKPQEPEVNQHSGTDHGQTLPIMKPSEHVLSQLSPHASTSSGRVMVSQSLKQAQIYLV